MQGTVILRAGTPNDENRDYLPEAIKGSDMVVNENGNNSQPYPERLVECTGTLTMSRKATTAASRCRSWWATTAG